MRNKRRTDLREKGITLVALVVTIIVLLILAGITISMALSNNGLIQRAKDASDTYKKAEQNELQQLSQFADGIDELTGKNSLSQEKIALITNNIKTAETLQEVEYEAKEITDDETSVEGKGISVTVEGAYSGKSDDQVFYQSEIGAIGSNKLKWYVLSADENGLNLVSEPTKKNIHFFKSIGYDNCLYFFNQLSTKLFSNEDYGVTEDRVHAFRLTDIKKAAEQANIEYKVEDNGIQRNWNWDLDVLNNVNKSKSNINLGEPVEVYNRYHPAIYTVKKGTTEVEANNSLYDEEPGVLITNDSGTKREEIGNPASKLTVNHTQFFSYPDFAEKLGLFGTTKVCQNIFDGNLSCLLANRTISLFLAPNTCSYALTKLGLGGIINSEMIDSRGYENASTTSGPFRVVISVPAKNVNVASDGSVTLKANNS